MEPKTTTVPPPVDEEEIQYVYSHTTRLLHKWPGCRFLSHHAGLAEFWTASQLGRYRLAHGSLLRCGWCFSSPQP